MTVVSLLHISDAQFGELCCAWPTEHRQPTTIVDHPFVASLLAALQKLSRPDLIIASGDLTSSSSPYEYKQHDAFCRALAACWDEATSVVSVAGNHDVSWDISSIQKNPFPAAANIESKDAHYRDLRFAPFLASRSAALWEKRTPPNFSSSPGDFIHVKHVPNQLFVVGLNTAAEDMHDTSPHHGIISDAQLELAEGAFADAPAGGVRVLVVHHHLSMMRVPAAWRDYSTAQNADALIARLGEWKVDLVLHGHRHYPTYRQLVTAGWVSHIFAAGSLATIATERMNGAIPPCAHLVEVEGRAQCGAVYGVRRTLTAGGGGDSFTWQESTRWEEEPGHQANAYARTRFGPSIIEVEAARVVATCFEQDARHVGQRLLEHPEAYGIDRERLVKLAKVEAAKRGLELVNQAQDLFDWKAV